MSLIQSIKRPFAKLAYALFSLAPETWERKFAILMDVLSVDPRRLRRLSPMAVELMSKPDWEDSFIGLDDVSLCTLRKFVVKLMMMTDAPHVYPNLPPFALWGSGLCTREEFEEAVEHDRQLASLKAQYHLEHADAGVCSLIYHHGLRFLPEKALAYLKGTVFIDAGACHGDSTLVFLHYSPRVVWAFEPSPPNAKVFNDTMLANGVPSDEVELISKGLSDQKSTIRFKAQAASDCTLTGKGRDVAELVPLDSMAPPSRIGLIKTDLEGMGMSMLRGAVQTIRRDKPVLSLSFYHNTDEFLNTYQFVKTLGLSYDYKVVSLCPPWENHDLTLLAWPTDLPDHICPL